MADSDETSPSGTSNGRAELREMIDGAMEGLRIQTTTHQNTWGLGTADRWGVDQEAGEIRFTFGDGKVATAPVQIIGTFNSVKNEWLWAWANSSIRDDLKRDADRVREFGALRGWAELTEPKWQASEVQAWEMVALANRICDSNGAYRGPAGAVLVFMPFGDVRLSTQHNPI